MLDIQGLSCFYRGEKQEVAAVRDLSFQLAKGDTLGLIGESGSGKSTVAWAMLGMLGKLGGHAHGHMSWCGTDYDLHQPEKWSHLRWKEIAIVPQTAMNSFNPVYTIGHSLKEVLAAHMPVLQTNEQEARVKKMLARVELEPGLYDSYPHQLSGGMRQRAALAKALVCSPKLLILDEATTGLDVITEGNILKTVAALKKELQMSLILITHDLRLVEHMCHQYVVLKDGVAQQHDSLYTKRLFSAVPRIGSKTAAVRTDSPVLEAKNITKHFIRPGTKRSFAALNNVSIALFAGSVTGLVGASGSGKTTLVNILFQLLHHDKGSVALHGKNIPGNQGAIRNMQKQMGLIRQDPFDSLPPHEKIFSIVAEPLMLHRLSEGRLKDKERAASVLADVGLDPQLYLDRYPHQMSGGQRQRVAIARALVTNPSVMVLDEPTSMLDATIKQDILQLIMAQAQEKNMAVLLVTHDLAAASTVCDDILVLHNGNSVESGSFEHLLQQSTNEYFRRLLLAATDLKGYWNLIDESGLFQ